jgi:SAM-dependent methyltransferase
VSSNPLADQVANQYESWVYPEPIHDLPTWLASNWQWFDPSHAHRLFWPERDYQAGMDILVAGCGTNQAAVFAYTNPSANVVAIDVSQASLDHHALLQQKYGLSNLSLHRLPIEDVKTLDQDFDLIISTGVLHHLADPLAGMKALASCLREDGVAAIMLYARYGRIGVEMLQEAFRVLGLKQDEPSLNVVKEAVAILPQDHPLRSYITVAPDLQYDAGLVDTFLHGRDRSYTVRECLELVEAGGLVFNDWLLKSSYEPIASEGNQFLTAAAALPKENRWEVMEKVNHRNGCHFFTAFRSERQEKAYRIDFASRDWHSAVPMFRYRCGLAGETLTRPGWTTTLTSEKLALAKAIDGQSTIQQIMETTLPTNNDKCAQNRAQLGLELFEFLVNRDFVTLRPGSHSK